MADRAKQAVLVEQRRAQIVHQAADVGGGGAYIVAQAVDQRLGGGRVVAHAVAQRAELHAQPGQRWPQAVVQIAAQAAALFLARRHKLLA